MSGGRRRAAVAGALAAALALLGAACGSDEPAPAAGDSTASSGLAAGAGPGPTGTTPPAGSALDGAATTAGTGGPGGDGSNGTTAPGGGGPSDSPPPATIDGDVPVGLFAPAMLRPDSSARVVVEVHADAPVRQATLDHVRDVLGQVSGKPVDISTAAAPGGGDRSWDADALRAAADAGGAPQGGGAAILRLLFVHGTFGGDGSILGIAVRGDVAAVFVDRVAAAGGLLGNSGPVEMSTTTHEVGHLLGLVDLYRDTGRDDPDHPGHSTNPGSVMYWAVESDVVGQLLGADPPATFDDDDLADLAAIRAGA